MVRDRFIELQKKMEEENNSKTKHQRHSKKKKKTPEELDIDQLLSEVDEIWLSLQELKKNVKYWKQESEAILIDPFAMEETISKHYALNDHITKSSHSTHSRIKELYKKFISHSRHQSLKTATTQHSSLLKEFLQLMHDHLKCQVEYYDRRKAQFVLQTEIAELNSDSVINQSDILLSRSIFTDNLLHHSEESKQPIQNVKERYSEMTNLEMSVQEIHDLYLQVALLVEIQAENVDRIEDFVTKANSTTAKASEKLRVAKHLRRKHRKRKFHLIMATVGVVATAAALIVLL